MKPNTARSIQGFSMLELMIALVLGLIVIGAMGTVFLSSTQTYRTTESLSRVQESARFAVQYISRELQMAGYASVYEADIINENLIYPVAGSFTQIGQVIVGSQPSTGVLPGTDVLEVRYGGNATASVRDCLGAQVPTAALVTSRIFVNASNRLSCSVNGGTPEELVNGIADMQLEYGVSDGVGIAYQPSTGITDWAAVVSVKMSLSIVGDASTTGNRGLTSVIALRNQLP